MSGSSSSSSIDGGAWQELMGRDLRLKLLHSNNNHHHHKKNASIEVGDVVSFDWKGFILNLNGCDDDVVPDFSEEVPFTEQKHWIISMGNNEIEPALEMGIRFMKDGQEGIIVSNFRFCSGLKSFLPEQQTFPMYFLVKVNKVVKSECLANIEKNFCLEHGLSQKQIGNFYFGCDDGSGALYKKACRIYAGAADMVKEAKIIGPDSLEDIDSDLAQAALKLIIDCMNNVAMANMKVKEYKNAKDVCGQIIQFFDPNNLKALCRAAQAATLEGNFEEADAAVKAALSVDSSNSDVKRMERFYLKSKREYKARQKEMFTRMGSTFMSKTQKVKVENIGVLEDTPIESVDKKQLYVKYAIIFGALLTYFLVTYCMIRYRSHLRVDEL